jgi:hypothetical protein
VILPATAGSREEQGPAYRPTIFCRFSGVGPFGPDVRRRIFDLAEIFGRKLDIRRSQVFFEPM